MAKIKYAIIIILVFYGLKGSSQTNQVVTNDSLTTTITFPVNGCAYNWVNNDPGIGLAASGSGNIAPFKATNTGPAPLTATIIATPSPGSLAFIPSASRDTMFVVSTATKTVVAKIPYHGITDNIYFATSPDGTKVFLGQLNDSIAIFNTLTNTISTWFSCPDCFEYGVLNGVPTTGVGYFGGIGCTPDGKTLYVNAGDTTVAFNTATGALVAKFSYGQTIDGNGVAFSPDGSKAYFSNWTLNTVSVINTASNTLAATIQIGAYRYGAWGLWVSPDGSRLYVTDEAGNDVKIVSTATNTIIGTIPVGFAPLNIVGTPDGKKVFVANVYNTVCVINTVTNAVDFTIPVITFGIDPTAQSFSGLGITPDGTKVFVINGSPHVTVINTATNAIDSVVLNSYTDWYQFGNFIAGTTSCGASPLTYTVTVNPGASPAITCSAPTGTITSCMGVPSGSPSVLQIQVSGTNLNSNVVITAPAGFEVSRAVAGSYGPSITIPPSAGTITNGSIFVRSAANAAAGNLTGNLLVSCNGAPSQSIAVSAQINPLVTPSLSIIAAANTICAGTTASFQATPTNGGLSPHFQWLVNGIDAGADSPSFVSNSINNGDVIRCILTSDATCASPVSASGNNIVMNVTQHLSPAVRIAASADSICAGSGVKFTATPVNGGSQPTYQWQLNGNNVGIDSPSFTSSNLINSDVVTCQMTSNSACATGIASSNGVTIYVNPAVTPSLAISSSSAEICTGATVTFRATPTNGGIGPTYSWLVNGVSVGTDSPTFVSGGLNNGDQVNCIMTSAAACANPITVEGIAVIMNVRKKISPSVSISASANTICAGTPVTFTSTQVNGGFTPSYVWLVNGKPSGGDSANFTTTNITPGDSIYCILTSSLPCSVPDTSQPVYLQVYPLPTVSFNPDTIFVNGGSVQLNPLTTGSISQYQWIPAAGLTSANIAEPLAAPTGDITYQLLVSTYDGCTATGKVSVIAYRAISMPNGFTPNGDGHNDIFRIPSGVNLLLSEFVIFSRWGNKVFSTHDIGQGWDGRIQGTPSPTGVYIYLITGKTVSGEEVNMKGTFILIR